MIQKLKAKGFRYDTVQDQLTGEFNGRDVEISVATNNNKVYRIMVVDAVGSSETDIKIRFNTLCRQFEDNKKYLHLSDFRISETEDISYEMGGHDKRYEATYYQMGEIDTLAVQEKALNYFLTKFTAEQFEQMSDDEKLESVQEYVLNYFIEDMRNRSVWFMIDERYGKYYIIMYYDNEYNHANGEDL